MKEDSRESTTGGEGSMRHWAQEFSWPTVTVWMWEMTSSQQPCQHNWPVQGKSLKKGLSSIYKIPHLHVYVRMASWTANGSLVAILSPLSLSHKLINAPRTYGCKHREVIICKSQRCILGVSFCLGHMPWSLSGQCDDEISDSAVFVSMETAKNIKLCFSRTRTVSLGRILYLVRIGNYFTSHCTSASLYIVLWNKKCLVYFRG